ncbi:MAG TPA: glycosyltransferase family 2 protein [Aggregatilineaceae bacterium]|nr:glycosyltransferase family 2 protein [Aggregatilineaceae bacterium]
MDLSIIIPCYNEVDNIPKLDREFVPVVEALAQTRTVEVIFVDDGCTDGTVEALQKAFGDEKRWPVRVERHDRNRGLGAAIRTGLAAAQGDVLVTTDSDGTYKFTEIPALLALLTPEVDIVTASPYHPHGGVAGVPAYRLVLSRGSSLLYRLLVSWRINTYTALFRAYRRSAIAEVTFQSDGFLAGTELLVKAMLSGARAVELPAVLHSRVHGVSKAKIMRTIRAHLGFQWRIFLHRLGLVSLVDHRPPAGG